MQGHEDMAGIPDGRISIEATVPCATQYPGKMNDVDPKLENRNGPVYADIWRAGTLSDVAAAIYTSENFTVSIFDTCRSYPVTPPVKVRTRFSWHGSA